MTTAAQLRKVATPLPDVEASTQDGAVRYTVRGKEFASLSQEGSHVRLRLGAAEVASVLAAHPTAEHLRRGRTLQGVSLRLADINGQQLNHWVRAAWKHVASKELAAPAEAAARAEPGDGGLPRSIGRPATRALAQAGITTLDGVARLSESELAGLHGVGPKAIRILREAIADR